MSGLANLTNTCTEREGEEKRGKGERKRERLRKSPSLVREQERAWPRDRAERQGE